MIFCVAPGKAFSMEKAPFKLNEELGEVRGEAVVYGGESLFCKFLMTGNGRRSLR